jgi:hypothetical protein
LYCILGRALWCSTEPNHCTQQARVFACPGWLHCCSYCWMYFTIVCNLVWWGLRSKFYTTGSFPFWKWAHVIRNVTHQFAWTHGFSVCSEPRLLCICLSTINDSIKWAHEFPLGKYLHFISFHFFILPVLSSYWHRKRHTYVNIQYIFL